MTWPAGIDWRYRRAECTAASQPPLLFAHQHKASGKKLGCLLLLIHFAVTTYNKHKKWATMRMVT